MNKINVSLNKHTYPIYIGQALLNAQDLLMQHIKGKQVLIVSNQVISEQYLHILQQHLRELQCDICILPEGEQHKTYLSWLTILNTLIEKKHKRSTTLIALGGGVIGDLTGFAAACYQRGVNYIQIPTTLLAQVDSAVGGKTGINHSLGKNLIGAFHQPSCVITDIATLHTLENRHYIAGLAEVIKYGLIYDNAFYAWLNQHIGDLLKQDLSALTYAIQKSCQIKAEIVSEDEKDHGIRNILNFGHSFAHVLETSHEYEALLHGEAVAIGMCMAAELSIKLGYLQTDDLKQIKNLLTEAKLPTHVKQLPSSEKFLTLLQQDKKNQDQGFRLILLKAIGQAKIEDHCDIEQIKKLL